MGKTYKHILVPLDGSELAEIAIDDAVGVAKAHAAKVTLLQAVQKPADHVIGLDTDHPIYLDQQWASQKAFVQDYLNNARRGISESDLTVNTAVELGRAAESIIDYARDNAVDLIVMATHGRSGLERWVLGSVAGKVMRRAEVPVLLVRAKEVAK